LPFETEEGKRMHSLGAQYFARFDEIVGRILNTEEDKIAQAAGILADEIAKQRLVYAWGTGGHDNRSAEELLWRAGGLACVAVILDPGLSLMHGATKATKIERMPGYAKGVLDYYQVGKDDTLLLINSYGINALTIDAVHACRERGTRVIAVTSFDFAQSVVSDHPARHPSKENLHEIVDLAINTAIPPGDAVVNIPGFPYKVAGISTLVNVFVLNVLVCSVVERLVQAGVDPPVWVSANALGGDAWNKRLLEQYRGRVPHL
jgi:uncharacterized phosphosugar-binding protein